MTLYDSAFTILSRQDAIGNEENDIFSIEVDGAVYVGQVQIVPVNDAPVGCTR